MLQQQFKAIQERGHTNYSPLPKQAEALPGAYVMA
jgi:hypothetical protein